jgi:hypothetical protein
MSLRAFHILFVTLSALLALGFGVWNFQMYGNQGSISHAVGAVLAVAFAAAIIVYGRWFLHKTSAA